MTPRKPLYHNRKLNYKGAYDNKKFFFKSVDDSRGMTKQTKPGGLGTSFSSVAFVLQHRDTKNQIATQGGSGGWRSNFGIFSDGTKCFQNIVYSK